MKFPFDTNSTDEEYYSELNMDDQDMFTIERRKRKDDLELQLRHVDTLENAETEGDEIIVEQFSNFMRNKRHKENKDEDNINLMG